MSKLKKALLFAFAILANLYVMAQTSGSNAAGGDAGLMRSEGKIYVVMAVVITILAGLIVYIIRLDKKITKLEKSENL